VSQLLAYGARNSWIGTTTVGGIRASSLDDPVNTRLDRGSDQKYDGTYLAGFGTDRLATGKHDDLWARALVVEFGARRLAIVSVDLLGYYSNADYYGAIEVRKGLGPKLGIREVLITSTHNHQGPDTVGIWGMDPLHDGKCPRYLQFVDRRSRRLLPRQRNPRDRPA
jgi:hypothetical protein